MTKFPELLASFLVSAVGKKLLKVMGSFHVFDSERSQFPDELEFYFEGEMRGKIYGNSSGDALRFSLDSLVEFDMEEHGFVKNFCVSNEPCFMDVVGRKLESSLVVRSLEFEDRLNAVDELGVQMQFCENHKLSILNLGDELYIFNEVPEKLIDEYKFVFIPVTACASQRRVRRDKENLR